MRQRIMSTPANGYKVSVAVFFWLNLPEPILMEVLKDAGFSEVVSRLPSLPIAPSVQVVLSPSRRLMASYKSVRVSWDIGYYSVFRSSSRDRR